MSNFPLGVYLALAGGAVLLAGLGVAVFLFRRSRRHWEQAVQAEHAQLDAVFEASPTGMVMFNDQLDLVRLNSAAESIAKGEAAEMIQQRPGAAFQCAHRSQDPRGCGYGTDCPLCPLRKVIHSVISGGASVRGAEIPMTLIRENGPQAVWLRVGAQPFHVQGRRQVVVAVEDITESKKRREKLESTTLELARVNEEIQCSNVAKGQFLANMSHELRTPLNGIIGMTGLLEGTAMTPEQQEFAETIRASGEALLVVVNDILDFSKIEANKMVLENEAFVLQQCVEEAVRQVMPLAVKKKLELLCDFDESLPPVWIGDGGRLRQVLVNLLGNALKFTERGEVVVSVAGKKLDRNSYQLDFAVKDSGVGIPPAQQDRLFQAFSQVDASSSRRFGGTGLGLAISRKLCELMGGEMSVESTGTPGLGSTFRFSVKVMRDIGIGARPSQAKMPHAVLEGKRVLIVDDNQASRELLKRRAEAWKMVPTVVASALAALDCLDMADAYDLALLDATMPEINGVQLAAEIRARPKLGKLPLIVLSPTGDQAAGGGRSRIDVCLAKPALASRLHEAFVNLFVEPPSPPAGTAVTARASLDKETARRHPLKILLAEDNIVNQKVAVSILAKLGYRVDVVANGNEAVDAVKRLTYDLVLMDVQMPELDGLQATARIRKEVPEEQQPWIVAMTANVMKGDRERYLLGGMNDYIPKPIRAEFLSEVLGTIHPVAGRAGP